MTWIKIPHKSEWVKQKQETDRRRRSAVCDQPRWLSLFWQTLNLQWVGRSQRRSRYPDSGGIRSASAAFTTARRAANFLWRACRFDMFLIGQLCALKSRFSFRSTSGKSSQKVQANRGEDKFELICLCFRLPNLTPGHTGSSAQPPEATENTHTPTLTLTHSQQHSVVQKQPCANTCDNDKHLSHCVNSLRSEGRVTPLPVVSLSLPSPGFFFAPLSRVAESNKTEKVQSSASKQRCH